MYIYIYMYMYKCIYMYVLYAKLLLLFTHFGRLGMKLASNDSKQ